MGEPHAEACTFRVFEKTRVGFVAIEWRGKCKFRVFVWQKRAVSFGKGWMATVGGSGVFAD